MSTRSPSPPPISASSLSALSRAANSPALTPPDPSLAGAWPIPAVTLYLLKVPSSPDLILTPLRPPPAAKYASTTDIASCLYYLHFQVDGDGREGGATLIRRDPATEQQVNVADFRIESVGNGSPKMLSPGEARRPSLSAIQPTSNIMSRATDVEITMHAQGYAALSNRLEPFSRHLRRAEKHHSFISKAFKRRSLPADSFTPGTSGAAQPGRGKTKGTWTTEAPWPGKVRFKDEAGGKFLKCKYYAGEEEKGVLLSVLEFKIPRVSFKREHRRDGSAGSGGSAENEGGGMGRTERAKIGMLVVHQEGLRCLDFVVGTTLMVAVEKWEMYGRERAVSGGM